MLAEMMREAERVVDHQIHALERADDRAQQLVALASGTLAGGVGIGAFLLDTSSPRAWFPIVTLTAAAALNLGSIGVLLDGYVGFTERGEARVGPSLDWIALKVNDAEWGTISHRVSILLEFPRFSEHNIGKLRRVGGRSRVGLVLLSAAVVGYAVAYSYILLNGNGFT